jgi:hypothetical protein
LRRLPSGCFAVATAATPEKALRRRRSGFFTCSAVATPKFRLRSWNFGWDGGATVDPVDQAKSIGRIGFSGEKTMNRAAQRIFRWEIACPVGATDFSAKNRLRQREIRIASGFGGERDDGGGRRRGEEKAERWVDLSGG